MYDNILVPTDGSEQAAEAVEHGINLAREVGATVHALYVVETKAHYILTVAGHDPEELKEHKEYGEEVVTKIVDTVAEEGLDGVGAVRTGNVAEEIVDYAHEKEMDLIVMGATGRSAIDKYLIGSIAEKVVRTSEVPVTTVRTSEDA